MWVILGQLGGRRMGRGRGRGKESSQNWLPVKAGSEIFWPVAPEFLVWERGTMALPQDGVIGGGYAGLEWW